MNMLTWRFDDLNFTESMSGFSSPLFIQKEIVNILNTYGCKATFGVITRYGHVEFTQNQKYYQFLKQLQKNGHEIAAHSLYHNSWLTYPPHEIERLIRLMRQDLIDMGIESHTFIFPWLQTNWKALPILKKYGFTTIIKNEQVHPFKKPELYLKNYYYNKKYDLHIFPPHDFSTEISYFPPKLSLPPITPHTPLTHVMDHIWLYKKEDLPLFSAYVKSLSQQFQWLTISQALQQLQTRNK